MPHVIIKLWSGKSEEQKRRLAEAITKESWPFWTTERVGVRCAGGSQIPGLDWIAAGGADTIAWLATLPNDGPTDGFFRGRRAIEW